MAKLTRVALSLSAMLACSRAAAPSSDGGADATSAAPSAAPASSVTASPEPSTPRRVESSGGKGSGLEARRSTLTQLEGDPVLASFAGAIRKQHGGALPSALTVQATDLGADRRRAFLVAAKRGEGALENPMVFVVDEHGTLLWSKERPAAGIKAPVGALAIAAGPRGRFALAVCDVPTSSLALRLWDDDGSPFADFQALQTSACDDVSLLYWPGHGWLLAASAGPDTRVQLVTEAGALAWGAGRTLGARFRTIAPASLASEGPSSFVLVQYAQSPGADRDVDHALAYRYDEHAQPLWPAGIDLGAVRRIMPGQERIAVTRSEGVLRAALVGGVVVEIRANGEIRRVP